MNRAIWILIGAWLAMTPAAHSHTLSTDRVLVDTDAGLDDLRAIALLLRLPGIEVAGVVTCDGSARADAGAVLVRALLRRLGRSDIPVWAGTRSHQKPPAWRTLYDRLAERVRQEDGPAAEDPNWREGAERSLSDGHTRATILALGPLSNLAELLSWKPGLAAKVSRIVWFGAPPGERESFNRDFAPEAARRILSLGLPVFAIGSARTKDSEPVLDRALLSDMTRDAGPFAAALSWLHDLPEARQRLEEGHLRVWDEAAALFLVRPESFSQKDGLWTADPAWLREGLIRFFRGPAGKPLVHDGESFDRFPFGPELFRPDLAAFVPELVSRFGPDEFRMCVLASEMHQHLGVYSIVGVKMGLRARELLLARDHPVQAVSRAGLRPPLSCLNDGLQIGAGATVGLGLLRVEEPASPRAEATFEFEGRRLTLSLKPAVTERIRHEIQQLRQKHGDFDAEYYRELRQVTLRLWRALDRAEIFDVQRP